MNKSFPAYSETGPKISDFDQVELEKEFISQGNLHSAYASIKQNLIDLSFIGMIYSDRLGNIIQWSQNLEELTGKSQAEVSGKKIWEIQHQLIPERLKNTESLNELEKYYHTILRESVFGKKQISYQKIQTIDGDLKVEILNFITKSANGNVLVTALRDTFTQNAEQRKIITQNEALIKFNQFVLNLSKLPLNGNIISLITQSIKEFTGAIGAVFSEYDAKKQSLIPKHIELDSDLMDQLVSLLDTQSHKIHTAISEYMFYELTGKTIEKGDSLTEISLGTIPFSVGATAQTILKAERFIRVSFVSEGKLYGTCMLAMAEKREDPPMDILDNFVTIAASSLRQRVNEKSVWKNEELLQTVTRNAADIILQLDETGKIMYLNRFISGFERSEVIGKNFCEWTMPEYYDMMIQALGEVFRSGTIQTYQTKGLGRNNEIRWYLSRISPVRVGTEIKSAILIQTDITEQKQNEAHLAENEQRFRKIAEAAFDVIFLIDRKGNQVYSNSVIEKLLGYSVGELNGKSFSELIPHEKLALYLTQLENLFLYKEMCNFTTEIYHKNGYLIDVEMNIKLINLNGEYLGLGTIRDITKKKEAEEKLRNSIERNNALLGANPDLMFVYNSNCKIIDFHSESHNQLLIEPEKFLGRLVDDILPHEVVVTTREKVAKVLSSGNPDFSNYELIVGNEKKYFESRYVPCGNNQVLSIVRDISEQKRAEAELEMAKESYLDIFNSVTEAIYLIDQNGNFLDMNRGAEKMYLNSKKELIGKPLMAVAAPEFNNLVEIEEKMKKVFETGNPESFDFWAVRKNGEIFPKEVIVNRGKFFSKNVLIHTARDITEKKQTEDRIKTKNEELTRLNAEKDKFFSIIAHDLRGPILSFLGITQIMTEDFQSLTFGDIQKMTEDMNKSANSLYGLLENLLEWSRLQRGMTNFVPKRFLVKPKIEEAMRSVLDLLTQKEIVLNYNIPENLEVQMDENMMASIIRNLVSNAAKFSHKGGMINVSAKASEINRIEISVEDTGIGMDEEMLNKLFSIDKQTNRNGTEGEPSSGLGLLLCKDFIEKHGGKLSAKSQEGIGSIFTVSIPANQ